MIAEGDQNPENGGWNRDSGFFVNVDWQVEVGVAIGSKGNKVAGAAVARAEYKSSANKWTTGPELWPILSDKDKLKRKAVATVECKKEPGTEKECAWQSSGGKTGDEINVARAPLSVRGRVAFSGFGTQQLHAAVGAMAGYDGLIKETYNVTAEVGGDKGKIGLGYEFGSVSGGSTSKVIENQFSCTCVEK